MWLMLRGELDDNNRYNLKHDTDMWLQLCRGLGNGKVWYKGQKVPKNVSHVFARGGFDFYLPILKKLKSAYIIRYGAGKRLMPEKGIKYNLILVDSEKQKKKVLKKFPKANVQIFFKPAANHFKPMDIPKKYDVGFVAAIPEDRRKQVTWVYKTLPKGLKVLQIGHRPKFKVPKNVTVKHVKSNKMPKLINQCRTIICPYTEDDSGPRIISEAMACDVRPFILNTTPHCYGHHFTFNKKEIWPAITKFMALEWAHKRYREISNYYQEHFSMEKAVEHLKGLINGS
jgi:hypothetical protein